MSGNAFADAADANNKPQTVLASQSKRVNIFNWFRGVSIVAVLTFLASLGNLPFIGKNKWIAIVAAVAATILGWLGQHYGVKDSGTLIVKG